jgi:hypothetical protein
MVKVIVDGGVVSSIIWDVYVIGGLVNSTTIHYETKGDLAYTSERCEKYKKYKTIKRCPKGVRKDLPLTGILDLKSGKLNYFSSYSEYGSSSNMIQVDLGGQPPFPLNQHFKPMVLINHDIHPFDGE